MTTAGSWRNKTLKRYAANSKLQQFLLLSFAWETVVWHASNVKNVGTAAVAGAVNKSGQSVKDIFAHASAKRLYLYSHKGR